MKLINIVIIRSVVGFILLPTRLFGRIFDFYMCKYVWVLANFIFTYINMYILLLLYKTV
jgi:hypothetical protein